MASAADSTSQKEKYEKEEKVLCKHGPCVYPAKILDIDDEQTKFLIHYFGWNPKWDEWVEQNRLDKFSDEKAKLAAIENKKVLDQMKKKKSNHHNKSKPGNSGTESGRNSATPSLPEHSKDSGGRSSPSLESTTSSTAAKSATKSSRKLQRDNESSISSQPEAKRKKVRGSDVHGAGSSTSGGHVGPNVPPTVQSERDYLQLPEIQVTIPDELRRLLVDDWELVTKQMKLVRLPAQPTVSQLLANYVKEKRNAKNISATKLVHICESADGMREYFDLMLSTQLLYKFEKPQYDEVFQKSPDTPASEIYGYPHLLRLFVKIGHMLTLTALVDKSVSLVVANLGNILKYLKKIRPKDLAAYYEVSSTEYQRKAYS